MKILLVEPNYKSTYPPLGLMKISAAKKSEGHDVIFVKGKKKNLGDIDEIYITSLFTFWFKVVIETILFYQKYYPAAHIRVGGIFASVMPEVVEHYTGLRPHIGLIRAVERVKPDYSLLPTEKSYVFTVRGCVRRCEFCSVPGIEGPLESIPNWEELIDHSKTAINFMDNNWTAKPFNEIQDDADKIKTLVANGLKEIDFSQGLDARKFTKEIAFAAKDIPFSPIRFALDDVRLIDRTIQAIRYAQDVGIVPREEWNNRGGRGKSVVVYVLYNYKDRPEDLYYRIRALVQNSAVPFIMRYRPVENIRSTYVGEHWTEIQRKNVASVISDIHGFIICQSKEDFDQNIGKDVNTFIKNISNPNFEKEFWARYRQSKYKKARALRDGKKI